MAFGLSAGSILGIGSSLIGGFMSSNSASNAADAQTQAAGQADATQRYQYDTTRADNAPFRETGLAANNRLSGLMGLGGAGGGFGGGGAGAAGGQDWSTPNTFVNGQTNNPVWEKVLSDFNAQHQSAYGRPMNRAWGSDGDAQRTKAALDAQYQQALKTDPAYIASMTPATPAAANPERGSLLRNFGASDLANDPTLNAAQGYMQPMRDYNASDLENDPLLKAAPGYFQPLHKFGQDDLNSDLTYQNGLQFGLDEGNRGIDRQASATGSFLSGATLKALTRFGNDYATTKTGEAYNRFTNEQNNRQALKTDSYNRFNTNQQNKYNMRNDSFNRFNTNQDRVYNKLAGLSGAGQQATNQVTAAGQNMANNVSENQLGVGNARGASYINQGNSWRNGLNGAVSAFRNSNPYNTNSLGNSVNNGYSGGWNGTANQNFFYGNGSSGD